MSDAWVAGMCTGAFTLLSTINAFILHWIFSRLGSIETKQDHMQTKEGCRETRGDCNICVDWETYNAHSHTSLPITDKVTR